MPPTYHGGSAPAQPGAERTVTAVVRAAEYQPEQFFVCQNCGTNYPYGKACEEMPLEVHPLCFCGTDCRDEYLAKHKRLPPIGAEIAIPGGVCNLDRAPDGRQAGSNAPPDRPTGSMAPPNTQS